MAKELPRQPHPVESYLRVGFLLHIGLVIFIVETFFFWYLLKTTISTGSVFWIVLWLVCFVFAFIHIFLVIMDGWSRYQDYKKAKDLLFTYGFRPLIGDRFIGSKCQRNAAIQAARELGIASELKAYYRKRGVRWHHFIPYFMLQDTLFFFRSAFWHRTFLEKNYKPRYNYRSMQTQPAA